MTPEVTKLDVIGCPCCGDDGALSDKDGLFYDGQALICGCTGHVCVEEDGDVWINTFDCACDPTG